MNALTVLWPYHIIHSEVYSFMDSYGLYSDRFSGSHKVEHRRICTAEVDRNTNKSSLGLDMSHLLTLDYFNWNAKQTISLAFYWHSRKRARFLDVFSKQ